MVGSVQHGRQICTLIVQRIILETKQNSRRNMTFFNFFGFWPQEFLTSDDFFAAILTKLRFASPEHNLIIIFEHISFFSSISIFEKKINFFTQNYRRSCQKCILCVQMTIWWKTGFPLKSVTVFPSLWNFKQILCGIFDEKFSVRL